MATKTIKEVTQGNEFKSQTHTVKLPNGAKITRTVNRNGGSTLKGSSAEALASALGKSVTNVVAVLTAKGVDVKRPAYTSELVFKKNHINKALRIVWESAGDTMFVYKPRTGYTQAIKVILGVKTLKASYTANELGKFEGGLLDQMFTRELAKQPLQLPTINGYKGEVRGANIVYGCASLPLAWFKIPNGGTRTIASITLNSGVSISATQVKAIYDYLAENKIK